MGIKELFLNNKLIKEVIKGKIYKYLEVNKHGKTKLTYVAKTVEGEKNYTNKHPHEGTRSQTTYLHLKELEKTQTKPKVNRRQ